MAESSSSFFMGGGTVYLNMPSVCMDIKSYNMIGVNSKRTETRVKFGQRSMMKLERNKVCNTQRVCTLCILDMLRMNNMNENVFALD